VNLIGTRQPEPGVTRRLISMRQGLSVAVALSTTLACAARSQPSDGAPAHPRISWELRSGDRRGDERAVCQSGASDTCVLDVTTDQNRMLAIVRLRLHGVDRQTNYVGAVRVPFLEGTSGVEELSVVVPADGRPVNRTILGRVTRTAGAFSMTFEIDAIVAGGTTPVHIHEVVPVTVQ
jgi:hypothetical protein